MIRNSIQNRKLYDEVLAIVFDTDWAAINNHLFNCHQPLERDKVRKLIRLLYENESNI
jgi:hypothetical protein